MSNFLLQNPDCIFIHIPKTGGLTIRKGLWENYKGPVFGRIPSDWPDVFRFAFVRHPLDRFISAYSDFLQRRNYKVAIQDFAEIVTNDGIKYGPSRSTVAEQIRHHTIPQTHPFNCLSSAHKIYRFELFDEEIRQLGKELNHKFGTTPHKNRSNHEHWKGILGRKLVLDLVDFYYDDFDVLGYLRP